MFASPKTTMRTIDEQMCPSHKGVRLTIVCLTEFFYEKGHQIGIRYIGCPSLEAPLCHQ